MANVYTDKDFRLITIESRGIIRHLRGGICGPITTPFWERISTVADLVRSGTEVSFINPNNTNQKVKATLTNIRVDRDDLFNGNYKEPDGVIHSKPAAKATLSKSAPKTTAPEEPVKEDVVVEKAVVEPTKPQPAKNNTNTRQQNNQQKK